MRKQANQTIAYTLLILAAVTGVIACYCFADMRSSVWKRGYWAWDEAIHFLSFTALAISMHRFIFRYAFATLALLWLSRLTWQIISTFTQTDINYPLAVTILFSIFEAGMVSIILLPFIKTKCFGK